MRFSYDINANFNEDILNYYEDIHSDPRYFEGRRSSSEAFRKYPNVIGRFPRTSEDNPSPSEDQQIQPEHF